MCIRDRYSMLPEDMVDEVFPLDDRPLMKTILRHGKEKMSKLHDYFQKELTALK